MARAIEDHNTQLLYRLLETLREFDEVVGGRSVDVDGSSTTRADRNLVHIKAGPGIEHCATLGKCDDGNCAVSSHGGRRRAVDWVDGNIDERRATITDLLAVIEHRCLVLLALANDHDAVHGNTAEHETHRVDGGSVGTEFVAPTGPTRRRDRRCFGDSNQFESDIAIWPAGWLHEDKSTRRVRRGPCVALGSITSSGNTKGVSSLVVKPVGALEGEVRAYGAKNAVLKQMAACLLATGEHRLTNVPNITDVRVMGELLEALGCTVSSPRDHETTITVPDCDQLNPVAPAHLFEAMRSSIVVLGPILARCGRVNMALPGGDDFGQRPINFHTDGLTAMGATFHNDRNSIHATTDRPRMRAARITLEYPSHTATDNLLMACVLAEGRSVIDNAAREPEVEDLGKQLIAMGAMIEGLGTSRLTIVGVGQLQPASHDVVTDRVVAATYLASALITGGRVRVVDARPDHMEMLLRKIDAMGGHVDVSGPGIVAQGPTRLRPCDVATLPYPGVATDYKPLITTMLSVANGVSVVTENLFVGRFRYVDELVRLGASITTEGHHAMIRGVEKLVGTSVRATDIRAAAALILAGLVAEGETTVTGLEHVDRGYDDLVGRLSSLGANIERSS